MTAATFAAGTDTGVWSSAYKRDGFVVITDFYTAAECDSLRARMHELIDDFDPTSYQTFFSTTDQEHARDEYFRTSGDQVRFFLEKDAVDAKGNLVADKHDCINKVGHALHDLDPHFASFSRKDGLAAIATAVGFQQPLLLQSMYIFKPPRIGGEVHCHQDSTFLYTEPESCVGFWVALEDATVTNGCLWVAPGGHHSPLRQRFRTINNALTMEQLDPTPMDEATVPLEAKKGSLVLLHGRLPHRSCPNTSTQSRQAYTFHIIDGACSYPPDNWLQRPNMPLRGFAA